MVLSDTGDQLLIEDDSTLDGLSDIMWTGDIFKLSVQADSSIFCQVVSLSGGTIVLDKHFGGHTSIPSYST